jgi:hypothetical protein
VDYILKWLKNEGNQYQFQILPSTLTFKEVCNLRISLDYASPSASLGPFSIHKIARAVEKRDRYEATIWQIEINWPEGEITFESSGFEQHGRGDPVISSEQRLQAKEREIGA